MKIVLAAVPLITTRIPPLSIALLAGQMKKDGHTVRSFDFNIETYHAVEPELKSYWTFYKGFQWLDDAHFRDFIYPNIIAKNLEAWASKILKQKPDVVGISVTKSPAAMHLARVLKEKKPRVKIVIGGPRCTKISNDSEMVPGPYFDAVVHHEGETCLSELVRQYELTGKLRAVPGTSVLGDDGTISHEGLREPVMDLNAMPFPDFDDMPLKLYVDADYPAANDLELPFYTSRGCPARCNFCMDYKMWDVKYRQKSPQRIIAEMEYLYERYGMDRFYLIELIFNGHHGRMRELATELAKRKHRFTFWGHGRIDPRLDVETLQLLKDAGFRWFIFGLESGSDRVLNLMRKGYGKETASKVLRAMKQVGINCSVNIVTGFPGETWGEFFETVQFIHDHRDCLSMPPAVMECCATQGSDIYLYPEKFGIEVTSGRGIDERGWRSVDGKNTLEVRLLRKEMMHKVFKELDFGKSVDTTPAAAQRPLSPTAHNGQ
ncbi:MAG: radical SAM protein [Deltaproteobacteria bacterium]|nr:radical SAM protein [Deltaproteobacteria bacterium]